MESTKPKSKVFPVTRFVDALPASLIPQLAPPGPAKRLIFIGDVHGMRAALERLLEKVRFDREKGDHLVFVGDLVNKGPDSPGVIDLAMELGASAVRGNHDNAVLDAAGAARLRNGEWLSEAASQANNTVEAMPPASSSVAQEQAANSTPTPAAHSEVTIKTASELSARHLEWIAALPLILRIDLPAHRSSSLASIIVTHAGLVPGVPLDQQDPHAVMHMRSIVTKDGVLEAAEGAGEESWAAVWERAQEEVEESQRRMVIFGHDAKRKLQVRKYSVGLDSGSVYGNPLSALVLDGTGDDLVQYITQGEAVQPSHDL
ncbi:protein phosphatase family protein [Cordyceps javanica]|uniref:Protein phosphatase family protein n=1 Tax=Cordyceps javanica TaxID=43265 RepID=A0A545V936_9HYPO|nr:protein phosphatase family protein [Cordyceps javanica]TQW08696.1 protein phosphatase family protein [Cordyceps javanica]